MTVRVLAGKGIVVFRERVVVLVIDEAHRQITIALVTAPLIREEEVFRQRIRFIPRVGDGLMGPGFLLGPAQCLLGQMGQNGVRTSFEHI